MPPPKAPVIENVGLETFLPIVISSVAVVFGTVGAIGCRMIMIPPADPTDTVTLPIEAGAFAFRDGSKTNTEETELLWEPCQPYKKIGGGDFDYEKDGLMGVMQIMAIIITAVGCLTVLGMWSSPCFPIHEMAWKAYGVLFFILGALQIITTQVNSSNICTNNPQLQYLELTDPEEAAKFLQGDCVWSRGIRFTITASCLWFIAGIVTLRTAAPRKKPM